MQLAAPLFVLVLLTFCLIARVAECNSTAQRRVTITSFLFVQQTANLLRPAVAFTFVLALVNMGPRDLSSRTSLNSLADVVDLNSSDSEFLTVIGFGSLLSETSSKLTFPELKNVRLARVHNFRRVFAHPASIFFQREIANMETLEMSSLSVEHCTGAGFVAAVYEVSKDEMLNDGLPSQAFLEREEEFHFMSVAYSNFEDEKKEGTETTTGICCTRSSDEAYIERWGQERFQDHFGKYGVTTIWNWSEDSGLRPCAVYLRHCYLAAKALGETCLNSFLDETFLVDRKTTIREYLATFPHVLESLPPPELASRYSG